MNETRLQKFHGYLCAVVEYFQRNHSLKGFSALAKQYKVKAIDKEMFYQFKLDELKDGQKPDRQLADKIRLLIADQDLKARQSRLNAYLKQQKEQDTADASEQPVAPKESTLAERIATFEARFDVIGPVFANISSQLYECLEKEFEPFANNLLGTDMWRVRLSPEQFLADWANKVEYDLASVTFGLADPNEVKTMMPTWDDRVMHAYLTWLYGGYDGQQMKFNFDERGRADSDNEQLIDLLRTQHLLDHTLFVKLESWKGCAHCVAVFAEAPDVLMFIGEDSINFYTIEDDIWYSHCGDTVISPDVVGDFGGWGTRSIVGRCLRCLLDPANIEAAKTEQSHVAKQMRGKLMDDINHYRDIWDMYHSDYIQQRSKDTQNKR